MISNERRILVGTTALAGVLAAVQAVRGVETVDGLWAPSWWVAAAGCLIGVTVALCPRPGSGPSSAQRHRWLMWAGLAAAVLVLAPVLMRAPWTLLMAIIWLGGKVTNGQAHFDLQPDWFGTGVLVTGLLAGGGLLVQAREDRRLGRQRCRRCGRSGAAVAMAVPLRRRTARVALGIVGGVGSVMLVPVGAMAVVGFTRVALGLDSLYDEGLRAWVFVLVYVSFMVWGAALSVLTATYLTGTRPPCADHARLPIPDLLGR